MMTFKELKKLVKLPLYKEQRVPTVKALEESGVSVVAEKILENHGSISVYQNGYVIYRAHKRVTVFSLRNCVHYKYDALEGAGHHIEEEEFDECRAFCFLRMGKEETVRCQSAIRIRPAACKKSIDLIFRDKDFLRISIVRPQYNADRLRHERIKSSYAGIVCETKESADGQQSYYCPGR